MAQPGIPATPEEYLNYIRSQYLHGVDSSVNTHGKLDHGDLGALSDFPVLPFAVIGGALLFWMLVD